MYDTMNVGALKIYEKILSSAHNVRLLVGLLDCRKRGNIRPVLLVLSSLFSLHEYYQCSVQLAGVSA